MERLCFLKLVFMKNITQIFDFFERPEELKEFRDTDHQSDFAIIIEVEAVEEGPLPETFSISKKSENGILAVLRN